MFTCSYINLSDYNKNILSFLSIGFVDIKNCNNPFSISRFIFRGDKGLYEKEYIDSEKGTVYSIFDDKIMKELHDITLKIPETDIDYDEFIMSKKIFEWIENEIEKYKNQDTRIVLKTIIIY